MTRGVRVAVAAALAAAVIGVAAYAYLSQKPASPSPASREVRGPLAQGSITPSVAPESTSTPSPSHPSSDIRHPGQDPKATLAAVLDARKRGDTRSIEEWATPEAATQLQSYPSDAFDPSASECRPAPDQPSTDVLCTLKPSRFMLGEVVARLRQTGEGFRLIRIAPVAD